MNLVRSHEPAPAQASSPNFGLGDETALRLKQLLIAALVALAAMMLSFLNPVDQFLWTFQSNIANQEPSGDIVFVGAERGLADPNLPFRRRELARALVELDRQGVGRIYIDATFADSTSRGADEELRMALEALGPRAILVDKIEPQTEFGEVLVETSNNIGATSQRVYSRPEGNWLGFTWTRRYSYEVKGHSVPSFDASLAGTHDLRSGEFHVGYGMPPSEIPTVPLKSLASQTNTISLAGKTIVIGERSDGATSTQRVPGDHSLSYSYIPIYAAETLKSGELQFMPASLCLAALCIWLIVTIVRSGSAKARQISYAVLTIFVMAQPVWANTFTVRAEISYCLLTLAFYGVLRSRSRWKNRLALTDSETGLPKLRALELASGGMAKATGHFVVARIHGYEHVLKTLPRILRAQYILKLVDRLRAADNNLEVFAEGHYMAWHTREDDCHSLAEHLEGLRSMFAAPIQVGGSSVDVGISFGVAKLDGDAPVRLAAAVAAAEESSEALQPVKFAESNSRFDELWDISLRARIDEAMEAGEIFCVYQPKIDTRTGTMTGVEALVRWQDPARGFIPPMHFIAQCEKAGRMQDLTRYVLEHACSAARLMHFRGRSITMSVNISATLLSDMRIVEMVRNTVRATGFDPRFLVLEVTETSRISNLETAEIVLNELKSLGARISMDDFGVGETNFQTFFHLPFDEVKVDRLFIANIAKSSKAKAIVTSVVEMGRDAGIGVVAEGAEDSETLKILTEIGCTHVQGYVLARPMTLDNLLKFQISDGEEHLKHS